MFKERTDWDSEVCGFRPATERAQEKRKHLREQIHTLTEIRSKIIYQLDTNSSNVQKLILLFHYDGCW